MNKKLLSNSKVMSLEHLSNETKKLSIKDLRKITVKN